MDRRHFLASAAGALAAPALLRNARADEAPFAVNIPRARCLALARGHAVQRRDHDVFTARATASSAGSIRATAP